MHIVVEPRPVSASALIAAAVGRSTFPRQPSSPPPASAGTHVGRVAWGKVWGNLIAAESERLREEGKI